MHTKVITNNMNNKTYQYTCINEYRMFDEITCNTLYNKQNNV